jgi:hypothetical protein
MNQFQIVNCMEQRQKEMHFPSKLLYLMVIFLRIFAFPALGHKMQTKVVKTI